MPINRYGKLLIFITYSINQFQTRLSESLHFCSWFSFLAGNADGMGDIRRQELHYSCSLLGIERGYVTVIDDARLPDGMAAVWPMEVVAEHVEAALRKCSASTVSYENISLICCVGLGYYN